MVYLGFPAVFGALIGEIARRPFARPTAVAPVPATLPGPWLPGPVPSAHPVFRRIACWPILPAAVPAVVCPSAGLIDFAPADPVVAAGSAAIVAAIDFVWTAVVASDSVAIAGSADSADFVVAAVAAGFVV